MSRSNADRLGLMLHGCLFLAFANSCIKAVLDKQTIESLPVLIPLIAVNMVGVVALLYCLVTLLGHVIRDNRRLGFGGKVLWFLLLLFGSIYTMPVYWYVHIVRHAELQGEEGAKRPAAMVG